MYVYYFLKNKYHKLPSGEQCEQKMLEDTLKGDASDWGRLVESEVS